MFIMKNESWGDISTLVWPPTQHSQS
jgi:hypothetical protein